MATGKVLKLYMTLPDMMRPGYRESCNDFECDPMGIMGDMNYENGSEHVLLLVSKSTYDIIEEADIAISKGLLVENIEVDIEIDHLKPGSMIEIGDTLFEVTGSCGSYSYLYAIDPEIPELIEGKRGIFITPCEVGRVEVGYDVNIVKEA